MEESRWKIFYSDGKTFTNIDGPARNAPFWDVQDIIQFDYISEKKYHQNHADYYIFQNGYWTGVDIIGLIDYLAHYDGEYVVRVGRTIATDKWLKIFNQAKKDDFISVGNCL